MRRLGAVLCVIGMLMLYSCAPPAASPVTTDFTCRFTAEYDGLSIDGTIERTAEKTLTVTFDHPDTLSGVTLILDGEQVRMRVFGIETALPQSYLPQRAFGTVINSALDDAVKKAASGDVKENHFTLSGTAEGYAYTLRCDAKSGLPLQLEVPELPLSVTFTDFPSP